MEEKDYKKEAEEYITGKIKLMNMTKEDYIKDLQKKLWQTIILKI